MTKYFSDRENKDCSKTKTDQISIQVCNGIAMLVNGLIGNNNLAKDFPRQCQDGNGIIGVDKHSFYAKAKSVIPTINFLPEYGKIDTISPNFLEASPFEEDSEKQDEKIKQFTYNTLDFIEFVFRHIYDVENDHYHNKFGHYELKFHQTTSAREKFVSDVNEIFERNHIAFKMYPNGEIQRIIDAELEKLIDAQTEPIDNDLRNLLQEAKSKIKNHKFEERKIALDRLWDAFERLKTIIDSDSKKNSANQLLEKASSSNQEIKKILDAECNALTKIGNDFQIRHYETNKVAIVDSRHLDYLFFRMYSLIILLMTEIPNVQ